MEGLPLSAVFDVSTISIGERAPVDVTFSTTVIGDTDGLTMTWDFGDGSELLTTTEFSVVHKYMAVGKYSPKLFVENGIGENAEFEVENGVVIIPSKVYVSKTGGNVWPFDTWESAANEIQDAVDLLPDEIEVAPGTYVAPDNGIAIPTAIYLYSSNGTNDTFITSRGANTSSRLVWLQHSDAIVDGFSLINSAGKSNGYVYFALIKSGKIINSFFGGAKSTERGVMVSISNGMVSNCVINARNENFMNGNGTTCGVFVGENGLLTHCEVYGYNYPKNTDYQIGLNSSVCLNHATAVVRNCYIHDSTASRSYGGGIRSAAGLIENCTVTRCSGTLGGGVYINDSSKTTIRNCIFYGNTSLKADGTGRDDFYAANNNKVFYSCASDLTDGENGNLSCNPKFSRDGFSLMAKSPCRNAGENQPWMFEELAGDISGVKRILGGTVDMGAFECQRPLPSLLFLK